MNDKGSLCLQWIFTLATLISVGRIWNDKTWIREIKYSDLPAVIPKYWIFYQRHNHAIFSRIQKLKRQIRQTDLPALDDFELMQFERRWFNELHYVEEDISESHTGDYDEDQDIDDKEGEESEYSSRFFLYNEFGERVEPLAYNPPFYDEPRTEEDDYPFIYDIFNMDQTIAEAVETIAGTSFTLEVTCKDTDMEDWVFWELPDEHDIEIIDQGLYAIDRKGVGRLRWRFHMHSLGAFKIGVIFAKPEELAKFKEELKPLDVHPAVKFVYKRIDVEVIADDLVGRDDL
eukprot:CAMPEP_0115008504 /NCGR_PEP_ID=MMETSP0216-20121206/21968_1 /TAXON_ID=223996 /ORGANISM="Protocruzia adherens, Strain Boccale" /LENGTH=287 /DNA_ID=CAMNT_0002375957 /DNA_START=8 /DNA_END=871 /DNA_ORIENTATION=+